MSNLVNTSGWLGAVVPSLTRFEAFPTVMARPRPGHISAFGDGKATQRYGVQQQLA